VQLSKKSLSAGGGLHGNSACVPSGIKVQKKKKRVDIKHTQVGIAIERTSRHMGQHAERVLYACAYALYPWRSPVSEACSLAARRYLSSAMVDAFSAMANKMDSISVDNINIGQ
jgi:hypothetical protein